MTDLQNAEGEDCNCGHEGLALDFHLYPCPFAVIRNAARLVANPNIQAHREAFYALVEDGGMYNPTFIDGLVAAALTPGINSTDEKIPNKPNVSITPGDTE